MVRNMLQIYILLFQKGLISNYLID